MSFKTNKPEDLAEQAQAATNNVARKCDACDLRRKIDAWVYWFLMLLNVAGTGLVLYISSQLPGQPPEHSVSAKSKKDTRLNVQIADGQSGGLGCVSPNECQQSGMGLPDAKPPGQYNSIQ